MRSQHNRRQAKPSITDSPWYWLYLFCTAGLIALMLVGPRFSARQAQIERKYQGRQRAAQQVSGQTPSTPLSEEGETRITLWPLYTVLAVLLLVAWGRLWYRHFRRPQTGSRDSGIEASVP